MSDPYEPYPAVNLFSRGCSQTKGAGIDSTELSRHPFIQPFSAQQAEVLARIAEECRFEPGQIIFQEKEESDKFYLLLEGRVTVGCRATGREITVQTLGPGEELGWSCALPDANRYFYARATERVRAFVFDSARLGELCDRDQAFGYLFLRSMVEVISERLQATQNRLIQMSRPSPP